jgi:hypothetical protein
VGGMDRRHRPEKLAEETGPAAAGSDRKDEPDPFKVPIRRSHPTFGPTVSSSLVAGKNGLPSLDARQIVPAASRSGGFKVIEEP